MGGKLAGGKYSGPDLVGGIPMWGLTGIRLYAIAGLGIALLISLGVVRYQHGTISSLRTDIATAKANLATAVSANESQSKAIDQCQAANDEWARLAKSPEALAKDLAALAQARADRDSALELLAERRRHATPQCQALLSTDFTAACADIDRSLRDAASHR